MIKRKWNLMSDKKVIENLARIVNDLGAKLRERPEVVRCKDCKHWRRCECGSYGSCEERDGFYDADWFCGDAEQKDGEGNG